MYIQTHMYISIYFRYIPVGIAKIDIDIIYRYTVVVWTNTCGIDHRVFSVFNCNDIKALAWCTILMILINNNMRKARGNCTVRRGPYNLCRRGFFFNTNKQYDTWNDPFSQYCSIRHKWILYNLFIQSIKYCKINVRPIIT